MFSKRNETYFYCPICGFGTLSEWKEVYGEIQTLFGPRPDYIDEGQLN